MPTIIPKDLPASKILTEENIFVMDEERASSQEIRPLKILIVNLMPTKIVTETQLLRMLSNSPLQNEIEFIHMASHQSKNVSAAHLRAFYKTFSEVKNNKYDGMIVTGAPVETYDFESVDYWKEIAEIMEWSTDHVFSSMFLCWGAQAALYQFYGIPKYPLAEKTTGIFLHKTNSKWKKRRILRGFDNQFYAPHSRYTTIKEEDILQQPSLDILAASDQAGVYLVGEKDGSRFFVTGHPEYDLETLDSEYKRDLKKGDDAPVPVNYYQDNDPQKGIIGNWSSHSYLLFANWLNYYVYQETPYDITKIHKRKKD